MHVVRCADCQAAVSEWAGRCPVCGAGLEAALPIAEAPAPSDVARPLPVTPGPDQVNKRRASRWLPAAILAATALIAGLVVASGRTPIRARAGAPASRPGPALRSFTVVYAGQHGVKVVPLDGRRPRVPLNTETGPPIRTSAGVAFVHDGTAYLLTPPYNAPPRPLVAADGLFPMVSGDMVGAERVGGPAGRRVSYINLERIGSTESPEWQFPPGYQPVGQFFALGPDGLLRGWSPGSGDRADLGPVVGHAAGVLGTVGNRVVWLASGTCGPSGECTLHVSTSDYPVDVDEVVPPANGHKGYLPGGAANPNGTRIAAFVATSRGHAQLAIVDTGILDTTLVPDSTITVGHGVATAQWTPDEAYVLFSGPGGAMHVYAPGSNRATTLDIKGSSSFSVG